MSIDNGFTTAFEECGDLVAIIRCTPGSPKKKRKQRSSSLPQFIIRVSMSDDTFCIEAINLNKTYRLRMNEQELRDCLQNKLQTEMPWNKFFQTLSNTFCSADHCLKVTKGKGGGYMILNCQYHIQSDIVLTNNFELSLVDDIMDQTMLFSV